MGHQIRGPDRQSIPNSRCRQRDLTIWVSFQISGKSAWEIPRHLNSCFSSIEGVTIKKACLPPMKRLPVNIRLCVHVPYRALRNTVYVRTVLNPTP